MPLITTLFVSIALLLVSPLGLAIKSTSAQFVLDWPQQRQEVQPEPVKPDGEPNPWDWQKPETTDDWKDDGVYRPQEHGTPDQLEQEAYVYQVQSMEHVNWLYIGYAPRMEDPSRIRVVFSKGGKTMRVSMALTRREVANYPEYLVRRKQEVQNIIARRGVKFYQPWRLNSYYSTVDDIRSRYDVGFNYNNKNFKKGLRALKERFPTNIFEKSKKGTGPDGTAVIAHFVYPITTHKDGDWPQARDYYMHREFADPSGMMQERRSEYKDGGDEVKGHDFAGFPAIWLNGAEAGTGVHGPIRFSRLSEPNNYQQVPPYGNSVEGKWKFWRENEFRGVGISDGFQSLSLRWDVVRTKQSEGCFRAETMELRHLLPSNKWDIINGVRFSVIEEVDGLKFKNGRRPIDVNYYLTDPYRFPMKRRDWVMQEIRPNPRAFLKNAYQFEYLDPATLEFTIDGTAQEEVMGQFNRAGGTTSL